MGFCDQFWVWLKLSNKYTQSHFMSCSWTTHLSQSSLSEFNFIFLFFSQKMMLVKQCLTEILVKIIFLFVKSRNILKTKRTYSSEDELTVKILISTMLMMQALIPRGLQISQVLLRFLQRIMKQTFPHLILAMICWLHPVHWLLDIHTLHRNFHWSLKYPHNLTIIVMVNWPNDSFASVENSISCW